MAEANTSVGDRLKKMITRKLTQNASWCGKAKVRRRLDRNVGKTLKKDVR